METYNKYTDAPTSSLRFENLPMAFLASERSENSSLAQVVHDLETNNEFRGLLENLRNSNQRLEEAKNEVSENKKLITKRAIAITGIVVSAVLLIAVVCSLFLLLPTMTSVALAIILGVSLHVGWVGIASFGSWAYDLFEIESLTPNAKRDLDFYSRAVETKTNQLKDIIEKQNPDRSDGFHESLTKFFIKNINQL